MEIIVGRRGEQSFPIMDKAVSGKHLKLTTMPDGNVQVEDLGSTNGTFIDGVRIASISGAKKTGKGQLMLPDLRIFGCAGKIGALDMKGELHTYEDMDNSNEKVIIRVKDFTYSVGITNIENCNKMVLTN